MNMHWGKNGPWYRQWNEGPRTQQQTNGDVFISLLLHRNIGRQLQLLLLAVTIAGTVIVLNSVIYNFSRMKHCVNLSRSLEQLLDAGLVTLPEYTQRQMLLAAEIQRLDSLTKPWQ